MYKVFKPAISDALGLTASQQCFALTRTLCEIAAFIIFFYINGQNNTPLQCTARMFNVLLKVLVFSGHCKQHLAGVSAGWCTELL